MEQISGMKARDDGWTEQIGQKWALHESSSRRPWNLGYSVFVWSLTAERWPVISVLRYLPFFLIWWSTCIFSFALSALCPLTSYPYDVSWTIMDMSGNMRSKQSCYPPDRTCFDKLYYSKLSLVLAALCWLRFKFQQEGNSLFSHMSVVRDFPVYSQ